METKSKKKICVECEYLKIIEKDIELPEGYLVPDRKIQFYQ